MAMGVSHDTEFHEVVQQLMNAGWYRVGQEARPDGVAWQFRQGHTLETGTGNERWILAPNETEAMRILWDALCTERAADES